MKLLKSLTLPVLLSMAGAPGLLAASSTWIATGNGFWATAGNWNNGVPGTTSTNGNADVATFNTSTGVTVSLATRGLNSLNFDTNAGSFTFSSGGFYFASGGGINLLSTMVSTGQTMTVNTPITAVGSFGINNNATTSNVLQVNGTITNSKTTAGSAILTLAGSNTGANTIAGAISDGTTRATQVNKGGAGTWRLTGANTYTGGTFVTAGSLVVGVGGTGSVAGAVTVSAGTLSGSGSAGGNVTVGDGLGGSDAFIAAGNSVGTFTVGGSLSMLSDATFVFELNSTNGSADKIVANGVTLDASSVFSFNDLGLGTGVTDGQVFTVIDNTSGSAIGGQFSNLANGSSFTSQGVTYTASYSGGTGNDLVLTASLVPEPGTCVLMLGGMASILYGRRRRLS